MRLKGPYLIKSQKIHYINKILQKNQVKIMILKLQNKKFNNHLYIHRDIKQLIYLGKIKI